MRKLIPLLLFVFGLMAVGCKSKDVPREDPQKKIDKAYNEHMEKNKEEYDKDPD